MRVVRLLLSFTAIEITVLLISGCLWSLYLVGRLDAWDVTVLTSQRLQIAQLALTVAGGLGAIITTIGAYEMLLLGRRTQKQYDAAINRLHSGKVGSAGVGLDELIELAERAYGSVAHDAFYSVCRALRSRPENITRDDVNLAMARIIRNLRAPKAGFLKKRHWSRLTLDLSGADLSDIPSAADWENVVFGEAIFRSTQFPNKATTFAGATQVCKRSKPRWKKLDFTGAVFLSEVIAVDQDFLDKVSSQAADLRWGIHLPRDE